MDVFRVFDQDELLFSAPELIEGGLGEGGGRDRVEPSSYQQRRHCHVLDANFKDGGRLTKGQPHDGLHAQFRGESPRRASAGSSKGGTTSAGETHHADARYIHSLSKPGAKGVDDRADVVGAIREVFGAASAYTGRRKPVEAGN